MDIALKPMERLLFGTELVLCADFACPPDEPLFRDSGPSNAYCFVFPSTSTKILRRGRPTILENPTAVSLLNRGEEYGRHAISTEGSVAAWYTLSDDLLAEIFHSASIRENRFRNPQNDVPPSVILRQRRAFERIRRHNADPIAIEEELVALAHAVIRGKAAPMAVTQNEKLVHRVIESILVDFCVPLTLAEISRHVGASPSYLSRLFHATTGVTMSAFRQRLRLIASLEMLPAHDGKLTDLALDLGYSSHSHFSKCFREMFDVSPTSFIDGIVHARANR